MFLEIPKYEIQTYTVLSRCDFQETCAFVMRYIDNILDERSNGTFGTHLGEDKAAALSEEQLGQLHQLFVEVRLPRDPNDSPGDKNF